MELKVRNIDFTYGQDNDVLSVNVRFDSFSDGVSLNGSVVITEEEYTTNATDLLALSNIIKTKVKNKLGVV